MAKVFKVIELNDRKITLCVKTHLLKDIIGGEIVTVGYSVCIPEDEFDYPLSKKIAEGRADTVKSNLLNQLPHPIFLDIQLLERDVLFGVATLVERKLRKGELNIVGIRPIKKRLPQNITQDK